jgi:hypothetical protein
LAITKPARSNPERGNQSAATRRPGSENSSGANFAFVTLVLMLSVDVAEAPAELCTVAGVRAQAGALPPPGETEQLSETDPLKPATEVTVTVEVAG